jgi:transposase
MRQLSDSQYLRALISMAGGYAVVAAQLGVSLKTAYKWPQRGMGRRHVAEFAQMAGVRPKDVPTSKDMLKERRDQGLPRAA